MSDLVADLRFAVRGLFRQPGFVVSAVLLLAIGIGATGVLLTIARSTFGWSPPGVVEPARLVRLNRTSTDGVTAGSLAYPDIEFYREQNHTLSGLAAYDRSYFSVMARAGTTREQVSAGAVSGDYFGVLGVRPAAGRLLQGDDDRGLGGPRVAVISHALWQRAFAGRADAVGAELLLGREPFTVVGVAPAGFEGTAPAEGAPDLWFPLTLLEVLDPREGDQFHRVPGESEYWLDAIGRLAPGVALSAARADLDALAARLEREFADWNRGTGVRVSADIRYHPGLRARLERILRLLGVVTAGILVIACANVALLLLARGAARGREMGIRRAVGAGSGRLVRQLLTEGAALALLGGVAGVTLAAWLSRAVGTALFRTVAAPFQTDLPVIGLTAAVAAVSVLAFGLAPAILTVRPSLGDLLRGGSGGARGGRLRAALVVTQMGLSLAMLTGAGLLVRSIVRAQAVPLGFQPAGRLAVRVNLEREGMDPARGRAFVRDALARLTALPGVTEATTTRMLPFRGMWSTGFLAEGVTPPTGNAFESGANAVGPDYFAAMGIPLVAGRGFTSADVEGAPGAAVVNQALARTVWGDADPLGRVIGDGDEARFTVVGVARDARYYDLAEPPQTQLYFPTLQRYRPGMYFVIATSGDPAALIPAVTRALRSLEPALVVENATTVAAVVDAVVQQLRTIATTVSAVGAVAVLLAALGLYGVLAFLVTQRTREFGIRLAVGASAQRLMRDVLAQGSRLALVGLLVGAAGAWAASRLARAFLFEVAALDPVTLVAAPLLLLGTALLASLAPARRAARVNPMEALRHD